VQEISCEDVSLFGLVSELEISNIRTYTSVLLNEFIMYRMSMGLVLLFIVTSLFITQSVIT
jgi:hypothetical protein